MKRIGNLYEKIYDIENLRLAHHNARKGKGWYKEVKMVNADEDKYLYEIQKMLINHTFKTSEYTIFKKKDTGKERTIFKLPYYPDRIVQWAIIQVIEPYLLKYFTLDTYSAIPGRGIHYGVKKIKKQMRYHKDDCRYCLKLDVRKFYPSIDRDVLKQQYRRMFKDPELLWLIDEIIDSPPEDTTGVPIGNYLSQYSGNLYLATFDHWIKEVKRVKFYHRYMDDIVVFGRSKEELRSLFADIKIYLSDNLKLTIKDNWQIFPTYIRGLDYLGYRFFGDYTLLRKSTCKAIKHKILRAEKPLTEHTLQSMQSYRGWLIHCDAHRFDCRWVAPMLKGA